MITRLERGEPACAPAELTAIWLGQCSRPASTPKSSPVLPSGRIGSSRRVHTVNCANGMIGYTATFEPTRKAPTRCSGPCLFYNMPRPRKGGLEPLPKPPQLARL